MENYGDERAEQNSTVSSGSEVVVESSQVYPAVVEVSEFGDGESKIISYIRINRVDAINFRSTQIAEVSVRKAEMDFMLDFQSVKKEKAADAEILKVKLCMERNRWEIIPEECNGVAKKLTTR